MWRVRARSRERENTFEGVIIGICISGKVKRKAKIELPADCARNMMGVADETGQLQYGQVFVYCADLKEPLQRTGILK